MTRRRRHSLPFRCRAADHAASVGALACVKFRFRQLLGTAGSATKLLKGGQMDEAGEKRAKSSLRRQPRLLDDKAMAEIVVGGGAQKRPERNGADEVQHVAHEHKSGARPPGSSVCATLQASASRDPQRSGAKKCAAADRPNRVGPHLGEKPGCSRSSARERVVRC